MMIANTALTGFLSQAGLEDRRLKPVQGDGLASSSDKASEARETAKKMESLFMGQLIKEMKKTLPSGGFLPQGSGGEMYETLLDNALADTLAQKGLGFEQAFERMHRFGAVNPEVAQGQLSRNDKSASGICDTRHVNELAHGSGK